MNEEEFNYEARLEQFRSVMQLGYMAFKSAMAINGAAVIALLTFIGNRAESDESRLVYSLLCFCIGVILSVIAIAVGYFAQYAHLEELKTEVKTTKGKSIGNISIGLVFSSYISFTMGCINAALALS